MKKSIPYIMCIIMACMILVMSVKMHENMHIELARNVVPNTTPINPIFCDPKKPYKAYDFLIKCNQEDVL